MKKQLNSTHTERLTIRISPELMGEIERKAMENELSVSAYVRSTLKNEIKKG